MLKPRKGVQKSDGGDGTGVFAHSVYCYCILRQFLLTSVRSTLINYRYLVFMTTVINVNSMNDWRGIGKSALKGEVWQLEGDVDGIDSGGLLPSPRYSGMCLELVDRGKLGLEGNVTVYRNEEAWGTPSSSSARLISLAYCTHFEPGGRYFGNYLLIDYTYLSFHSRVQGDLFLVGKCSRYFCVIALAWQWNDPFVMTTSVSNICCEVTSHGTACAVT